MGKLVRRSSVLAATIALLGIGSYAVAGGGTKDFEGSPLSGYEENPDISTTGTGSFEARVSKDGKSLQYELGYSGLEGNVLQAHVHFGKRAVNGGISFFLCTNLNTPTNDDCPQAGKVEGDIDATDVIGPNSGTFVQGIEPGAFNEILAAMRAGHAYANVHTSKWPGGEIRAQIDDRGGRGKKDD
jgi:CHRD domain